jgi:hypothetical protein
MDIKDIYSFFTMKLPIFNKGFLESHSIFKSPFLTQLNIKYPSISHNVASDYYPMFRMSCLHRLESPFNSSVNVYIIIVND